VVRTLTEWLLLPLFLLPFAVGGGLAWFAAETHWREMDHYARSGETEVRLWLQRDSHADTIAGIAERALAHIIEEDYSIGFTHPGGRGRVAMGAKQASRSPWLFTRSFPSGLLPDALADAGIRLQVETGAAPGALEGADTATVSFRELYGKRDLEALRDAPLPVSTKRFLVGRWRQAGGDAGLAETARFLDALEAATRQWPRPPGWHRIGDLFVLAARGDGTSVVIPDLGKVHTIFALKDYRLYEDGDVRISWPFLRPDRHPEGVLWSGRVEEPYAGEWLLSIPGGTEWWRSPRVRRWAGPVGAGLLLFTPLAFFGAGLLACVLCGAVWTHYRHDPAVSMLQPAVVLVPIVAFLLVYRPGVLR